jgi:hypothetical protein
MDSSSPHSSPLSRCTLRRSYPREEPYAVIPLVRICAGGGQRCSSLPQPGAPFSGRNEGRRAAGITHDYDASMQIATWTYEQEASAGGVVWVHGNAAQPISRSWQQVLMEPCGP